jgi:alkaline phosphatase D
MRSIVFLFIILSLPISAKTIDKISLGSCLSQDNPQPIWDPILNEGSDIFIFMGDNVYGDDKKTGNTKKLKRSYIKQKKEIPFKDLKKTNEVMAIWDDHDFGKNDGGYEYIYKDEAKELFLDFWDIPTNDKRRQRSGLYFETKKKIPGGILQIIFLDTRYFKSSFKITDKRNAPLKERYVNDLDASKTILGKEQWNWLRKKLEETVDMRIIVSSIQIIAEGHGYEKWGLLPLEKQKLYNLIDSNSLKNTILISGDRHAGAIYKDTTLSGKNIYELTSSSLNLPGGAWASRYKKRPPEPGPNRIDELYVWENYGLIEFINDNTVILSLKDIKGKNINQVQLNY